MEFQAVVMAAGRGGQMSDLTSSIPKPLLPVGNKPLIWYTVNMLERVGFKDVIIITLSSIVASIKQVLSAFKGISADVVGIAEDTDWGTIDSLRHIKDKIKAHADVLVLSCDILSDFHLHLLADVHRLHDTTVTMLVAPARPEIESVPGVTRKRKQKRHREIIGLTKSKTNKSRVIFLENEADIEDDEISFSHSLLMQQPNIYIRTDLTDMHLYIIKKSLLDFIAQNTARSSIRSELLPYLVKKQWKKCDTVNRSDDAPPSLSDTSHMVMEDINRDSKDIFSYLRDNPDAERIRGLSLKSVVKKGAISPIRDNPNPISVHAYVYEEGFCMRVNSLQAFVEANRLIAKHVGDIAPTLADTPLVHPSVKIEEKTQIGSDSMVAEDTKIGTRVSIKRSSIGKHCVIGNHTKIVNCTMLDRVIIKDGCVLQGSVVCDGVEIGEKSTVKDCLIGSKRVLQNMTTVMNESLVESTAMMEFD